MTTLLATGRRRLLLAAVLSATTYGCGIALMGCAAWLLSRAAEHPAASTLALVAVAVRALGLGRGLSRYAERLVGHDATLRVVADVRVSVFSALARGRATPRSGDVLSTVVTDVDAVQDLWLRIAIPAAAAVLASAASVAACLWWSTAAGLALLLGLGSSLVVVPTLAFLISRRETGVAEQRASYQVQVVDVLQGCADLTVLGELPTALAQVAEAAAGLAAVDRQASLRWGLLTAVTGVLQTATVLGVAAVALPAVHNGSLPRVALAVLVLVTLASFEPIAALAESGSLLPRTAGALRRLSGLLDAPTLRNWADAPADAMPHLRGVEVSYGRSPVLDGVDLELRPGRCVALVGSNGAGKSTLLRVLTGALVPDRGNALIGAAEISALDDAQRAGHVVLAEQEAHLFATSVADNLRIAKPTATDAELMVVLETVGLQRWFDALPKGWETPLGERGSRVSGGERNRLCVARALLSPAPVLLLDEPTEGLDQSAAAALLRSIIGANRHRALLLVTHHKAALALADEVLVLSGGVLASERSGNEEDAVTRRSPATTRGTSDPGAGGRPEATFRHDGEKSRGAERPEHESRRVATG